MANYAPNAELLLVSSHLMCLVCVVQMAENHIAGASWPTVQASHSLGYSGGQTSFTAARLA
jgi:hypothetical protein